MVRARIMEVMAGPGSVWGTTSPWHGITILSSFPPCCHWHHSPGLTSSLIPYHMHTPCIAHGTLAPIASTCPQAFHSPCCALLPCPPASTSPPPQPSMPSPSSPVTHKYWQLWRLPSSGGMGPVSELPSRSLQGHQGEGEGQGWQIGGGRPAASLRRPGPAPQDGI